MTAPDPVPAPYRDEWESLMAAEPMGWLYRPMWLSMKRDLERKISDYRDRASTGEEDG